MARGPSRSSALPDRPAAPPCLTAPQHHFRHRTARSRTGHAASHALVRQARETSSGSKSGRKRTNHSGWRQDFPDHATSAETSPTNGSTRVRSIGAVRALNRPNVPGEMRAGQGCSPTGRRSSGASARRAPSAAPCGRRSGDRRRSAGRPRSLAAGTGCRSPRRTRRRRSSGASPRATSGGRRGTWTAAHALLQRLERETAVLPDDEVAVEDDAGVELGFECAGDLGEGRRQVGAAAGPDACAVVLDGRGRAAC